MAAFRLPDPSGDLRRQITAFRHTIKRATRSHSQMMQKSDAAPQHEFIPRARYRPSERFDFQIKTL